MLATRKLTIRQIQDLYGRISQNKVMFSQDDFNREFGNIEYFGKTTSFTMKKTQTERARSKSGDGIGQTNFIGGLRDTRR
jgi:pyruvate-formate lyase